MVFDYYEILFEFDLQFWGLFKRRLFEVSLYMLPTLWNFYGPLISLIFFNSIKFEKYIDPSLCLPSRWLATNWLVVLFLVFGLYYVCLYVWYVFNNPYMWVRISVYGCCWVCWTKPTTHEVGDRVVLSFLFTLYVSHFY